MIAHASANNKSDTALALLYYKLLQRTAKPAAEEPSSTHKS
jgi:hypothetical protein